MALIVFAAGDTRGFNFGVWAITSYYNPVGYKRRLSNYRTFRAHLGVPLVAVELSFDGRFELTDGDADILIQISGGAVLWQKERLLNIGLKAVPKNTRNIAWVDCDVVFERADWVHEAELKLKKLNVVQLFCDQVDLSSAGYQDKTDYRAIQPSGQSVIDLIGTNAQLDSGSSSSKHMRSYAYGLAWAANRDIIEEYGFYDAMIAGGGDHSLAHALFGQFEEVTKLHYLNFARQRHYLRWARGYRDAVSGKVGNVSGRLYHLWHGRIENRNYFERHRLLAKFEFEPDVDLLIGANGAWQWARPRPELEKFLAGYFTNRAEDEQPQV